MAERACIAAIVADERDDTLEESRTNYPETRRHACQIADTPFIDAVRDAARRIAALFEEAIAKREITLAELFDRSYRPIPNTNPSQAMAAFTLFTDWVLPAILEPLLARDGGRRQLPQPAPVQRPDRSCRRAQHRALAAADLCRDIGGGQSVLLKDASLHPRGGLGSAGAVCSRGTWDQLCRGGSRSRVESRRLRPLDEDAPVASDEPCHGGADRFEHRSGTVERHQRHQREGDQERVGHGRRCHHRDAEVAFGAAAAVAVAAGRASIRYE
jgi:hypothetical protein